MLAASVAATMAEAQEAAPASKPQAVYSDTAFFAEGLAADPRTGTLFVTSIHRRNVLVVAADGSTRWLLSESQGRDIGAVFGAVLDSARGSLWITSAKLPMMAGRGAADSAALAELLEIRLRDGAVLRRLRLGIGDGMPGEIALAPDGSVLVSDGMRGQLYRLRPAGRELEIVRSPALRSPQGIAPTPDGSLAYVADWSRGILRWDLATDSITPVTLDDGRLLRGVDGLRWHDGALIGIQNGASPNRVLRIGLGADGRSLGALRVLDAPPALEGEMTVGVVLGREFVYVASSAWPFWTEEGQRRPERAALPPVVLRRLPLP
ncbi:MAG: hypothetical protein C0503_05465 [Gemmatimonas sp.]|nr:hypothetical protein [Gemmatimonas sp.]